MTENPDLSFTKFRNRERELLDKTKSVSKSGTEESEVEKVEQSILDNSGEPNISQEQPKQK